MQVAVTAGSGLISPCAERDKKYESHWRMNSATMNRFELALILIVGGFAAKVAAVVACQILHGHGRFTMLTTST